MIKVDYGLIPQISANKKSGERGNPLKIAVNSTFRFTLILAVLAGLLGGCGERNQYQEPPPPKVTVATPLIQDITDYLEFTGTLVATGRAEVRARVSGILESMHFVPGTWVNEDDLLFVIEPAEYEADLKAAEAELAAAKAQFRRATIEHERARKLYKEKAGAEADVVKWQVEKELSSADILRAEAKVERASLNLGYTQVSAPISGRVGRNEVDLGNLVGEGEATILTEITSGDPIYAYFNLNERDLLRVMNSYRQQVDEKGLDPDRDAVEKADIPVFLGLADEDGYPHEGEYDFAESEVDPQTGTLQLRGIFNNPGKPPKLLPGLFARLRMPLGVRENMPLVTQRAIAQDQSGTYVLVVNTENTVEQRSVKTGRSIDGMRVIEQGLSDNDRVVVDGLQRARPGRKVEPAEVDMATLTLSNRLKAEKAAGASSPTADQQPADTE
jgi:RND family efflux transporter MFP subunit